MSLDDKRLDSIAQRTSMPRRSYTDFLIEVDSGKPGTTANRFSPISPSQLRMIQCTFLNHGSANTAAATTMGYEALKEKRAAAAKRLGLVSDSAQTPGPGRYRHAEAVGLTQQGAAGARVPCNGSLCRNGKQHGLPFREGCEVS